MIVEKIKITKDGSEILLRCATAEDAEMLLSGYKKMLGETQFLSCGPDEISLTVEQEKTFIEGSNKDKDKLLLLAFVNGKYAGNCNFAGKPQDGSPCLSRHSCISGIYGQRSRKNYA